MLFDSANIIYFFTKQATLIMGSTVLSLPFSCCSVVVPLGIGRVIPVISETGDESDLRLCRLIDTENPVPTLLNILRTFFTNVPRKLVFVPSRHSSLD